MSDSGATTTTLTSGTTTPQANTGSGTNPNDGGNSTVAGGQATVAGAQGNVLGDSAAPQPEPFDPAKLALPEGFKAEGEGFDQFKELAKDLPHSVAQKFVDLHTKAVETALNKLTEDWAEQQRKWQEEINKDSELGGGKLTGVKETVAKVLDNPEIIPDGKAFREALIHTGAGNNPVVVRGIYRMAKLLTEGRSVQGQPPGSTGGERPTPAQAMYGPSGPYSGGPNRG